MRYEFTKMQALSNDFVVLDCVRNSFDLSAGVIRFLADRRRGIGCDQVLVAQPPRDESVDFVFRIFNQDGSEAAQCGNGARCLAKFLNESGLTDKKVIRVQTFARVLELRISSCEFGSVDMGAPIFTPAEIPLRAAAAAQYYAIELDGKHAEIGALNLGNPHAVMRVDDVAVLDLERVGKMLAHHRDFPEQTNAGFMQVVARDKIRLRVFERGVGETQGCGSGACAAAVIGINRGWLDNKVTAELPGGEVLVEWGGGEQSIKLSGPAHNVFSGAIEINTT